MATIREEEEAVGVELLVLHVGVLQLLRVVALLPTSQVQDAGPLVM